MFRVENTGMPAWKRIVDKHGVPIADLDELYNGDWALVKKGSLDRLCESSFSTANKANNWLWKNRYELGEPFSLYEDEKKVLPKKKEPDIVVEEVDNNDLFWNLGK